MIVGIAKGRAPKEVQIVVAAAGRPNPDSVPTTGGLKTKVVVRDRRHIQGLEGMDRQRPMTRPPV